MDYHNPKIPEGINVSSMHPLKEFFALLAGIGIGLAALLFLLSVWIKYLSEYIPFGLEVSIADKFISTMDVSMSESEMYIESYLQQLADRLTGVQSLPEGMTVTVHYVPQDTVNALATLGGNIYIYKGLLEKIPHENALAMVVGHEIAHVVCRDPVTALVRSLTFGAVMGAMLGSNGDAVFNTVAGQASSLVLLKFSREQEERADQMALDNVYKYYHHAQGADVVFQIFRDLEKFPEPPTFLSTHPQYESRIKEALSYIESHPNHDNTSLVALPERVRSVLENNYAEGRKISASPLLQ